jgi:hypothetical protein
LKVAEDPIVAELEAAAASLVMAKAAAENGDWAVAEQSALDAQSRAARVLKEIQLKLVTPPPPVVSGANKPV